MAQVEFYTQAKPTFAAQVTEGSLIRIGANWFVTGNQLQRTQLEKIKANPTAFNRMLHRLFVVTSVTQDADGHNVLQMQKFIEEVSQIDESEVFFIFTNPKLAGAISAEVNVVGELLVVEQEPLAIEGDETLAEETLAEETLAEETLAEEVDDLSEEALVDDLDINGRSIHFTASELEEDFNAAEALRDAVVAGLKSEESDGIVDAAIGATVMLSLVGGQQYMGVLELKDAEAILISSARIIGSEVVTPEILFEVSEIWSMTAIEAVQDTEVAEPIVNDLLQGEVVLDQVEMLSEVEAAEMLAEVDEFLAEEANDETFALAAGEESLVDDAPEEVAPVAVSKLEELANHFGHKLEVETPVAEVETTDTGLETLIDGIPSQEDPLENLYDDLQNDDGEVVVADDEMSLETMRLLLNIETANLGLENYPLISEMEAGSYRAICEVVVDATADSEARFVNAGSWKLGERFGIFVEMIVFGEHVKIFDNDEVVGDTNVGMVKCIYRMLGLQRAHNVMQEEKNRDLCNVRDLNVQSQLRVDQLTSLNEDLTNELIVVRQRLDDCCANPNIALAVKMADAVSVAISDFVENMAAEEEAAKAAAVQTA